MSPASEAVHVQLITLAVCVIFTVLCLFCFWFFQEPISNVSSYPLQKRKKDKHSRAPKFEGTPIPLKKTAKKKKYLKKLPTEPDKETAILVAEDLITKKPDCEVSCANDCTENVAYFQDGTDSLKFLQDKQNCSSKSNVIATAKLTSGEEAATRIVECPDQQKKISLNAMDSNLTLKREQELNSGQVDTDKRPRNFEGTQVPMQKIAKQKKCRQKVPTEKVEEENVKNAAEKTSNSITDKSNWDTSRANDCTGSVGYYDDGTDKDGIDSLQSVQDKQHCSSKPNAIATAKLVAGEEAAITIGEPSDQEKNITPNAVDSKLTKKTEQEANTMQADLGTNGHHNLPKSAPSRDTRKITPPKIKTQKKLLNTKVQQTFVQNSTIPTPEEYLLSQAVFEEQQAHVQIRPASIKTSKETKPRMFPSKNKNQQHTNLDKNDQVEILNMLELQSHENEARAMLEEKINRTQAFSLEKIKHEEGLKQALLLQTLEKAGSNYVAHPNYDPHGDHRTLSDQSPHTSDFEPHSDGHVSLYGDHAVSDPDCGSEPESIDYMLPERRIPKQPTLRCVRCKDFNKGVREGMCYKCHGKFCVHCGNCNNGVYEGRCDQCGMDAPDRTPVPKSKKKRS